MTPEQQPDTSKRPMVIAVCVLGAIVAIAAMMLAPAGAGDRPAARADPSKAAPAAAAQGELVANGAGGTSAPATPGAAGAPERGNAPLTVADDEASKVRPYTSESSEVDSSPREQQVQAEAAAELERSTTGIHGCLAKAQAVHERKGGTGRVDPLWCVYDYTAMPDEQGRVKFDVATRDTFSYYVEVAGLRYRYTETNGTGCRSVDGTSGCSGW